ncbi:hypothetical protein [Flavobacterium humidisoli]|uniref:Uncharacterized protein n=1 Tax=Flavobacterium humidisoli TaxID=2937442 RepID=A0ABY4LXZ4_9FLAO|nr:hypothetical protein [Flavobacterium humidisoli]UPZ17975.1 hypothetical protein M0M44_11650 [Flavobacterium humidisoli]
MLFGKKRLSGDTTREDASDEAAELLKKTTFKGDCCGFGLRCGIVKKTLDILE